jgi:tetratricopeptide (TPR) repeat protein
LNLDLDEVRRQVWRDGDSELHADFVEALLGSSTALATRFAALNAYYHLMEHKRGLEEEDLGGFAKQRERFRKKLAIFVGFRSVESCTDLRTIRWEIVNSCAAEDYSRAFRLCDQLQPLLPDWHVSLIRGRLHFLAVHLPLWDDRPSLSSWDLPTGPPTADNGRMLGIQLPLVNCLSSPELTTGIPDGARAHLRKAIAELEIALDGNPDVPSECHLMLARSYAAVGQDHEAARCFRRVLTHRGALLRYFEEPSVHTPEQVRLFLSALFERLVTAHHRAEEIDEAIKAAGEWIDEFPDAPNAYPLMARLHDEKGDPKAAAGWHRRGEERIPELGDDWKTSLILKLDEISPTASIDQTINTYSAHHPDAIRLVSFALERHWSAFTCLDEESKQRWSMGIHILNTKSLGEPSPGFAVHAFSGVIERTLREFIFVPFREAYRLNPELVGDISRPSDDAKVFCKFLGGNVDPAFGQMLTITMKSVKSARSPFSPFAEWLRKTHPSYFGRIGRLREEMMIDLRNREDHLKKKPIAEGDAEKMLKVGVEMVSVILEDPARANPV